MSLFSFTNQDADRLLGLADQFLEDWEQNDGKDDPECIERRAEWNTIRPLLVAAPPLLAAIKRYINVPVLPDPGFENELVAAIEQAQDAIAGAEGGAS